MAHWRIRSIKLISLIFRRLDRFRNNIIDTTYTYVCTHMCCSYKVHTLPSTRKYTFSRNITYSIYYHRKKNQKNDWEKMYNGLQRLHFLKTCK